MSMLELTIARPCPPIRTLEIEERDGALEHYISTTYSTIL